jgi:hypothetical protein
MNVKEKGFESRDRIQLAYEGAQWQTAVSTVIIFEFHKNGLTDVTASQ